MKYLLLLILPIAFSSCRTKTPLDPNTLKPSDCMLPEHTKPYDTSCK